MKRHWKKLSSCAYEYIPNTDYILFTTHKNINNNYIEVLYCINHESCITTNIISHITDQQQKDILGKLIFLSLDQVQLYFKINNI
jgi:hypothetical protein